MEEENGIFEEDDRQQPDSAKKDPKISILYAQVFCVALLLTGLMALKIFFPSYFTEIKKWYQTTFLTETSVSDVLDNSSEQSSDSSTVSENSSVSNSGSSENVQSSSGDGASSTGSTVTESTNQKTTDTASDTSGGESHAF